MFDCSATNSVITSLYSLYTEIFFVLIYVHHPACVITYRCLPFCHITVKLLSLFRASLKNLLHLFVNLLPLMSN